MSLLRALFVFFILWLLASLGYVLYRKADPHQRQKWRETIIIAFCTAVVSALILFLIVYML